jgi:hypothetical protein
VFLIRFKIRAVDVPANRRAFVLRLDKDDLVIEACAYIQDVS